MQRAFASHSRTRVVASYQCKVHVIFVASRHVSYQPIPEQVKIENNVNALTGIKRQLDLDDRGVYFRKRSSIPCLVDHKCNRDIIIVLDTCQSAQQIVSLIEQNVKEIHHASIYGKAMQKCHRLREFKAVQTLFSMMLQNDDVAPSIVEFTVYINSMASADRSTFCIKAFQTMIQKFGIAPNDTVFACMLKAMQPRHQVDEAERIWDMMVKQYKVLPNCVAYIAMMGIYARLLNVEKSTALLQEFEQQFSDEERRTYIQMYHIHVSLFSKLGDIPNMKKALAMGIKRGLALDDKLLGVLMWGYTVNGRCKKAIKLLDAWLAKGNQPSWNLFCKKCTILEQMISDTNAFEEKEKHYTRLVRVLTVELEQYGLELNPFLARQQLTAAIKTYHNQDPQKLVRVLEELTARNLTGYLMSDRPGWIDLHLMLLGEAQLVIRYIFAYKLQEIVSDETQQICIMTGKGTHNSSGHGVMYTFIQNELQSWQPPINPQTRQGSYLVIDRSQFMPYLNDENNYAKQKLTVPSNDWHTVTAPVKARQEVARK